jgi:peptidoglycan hydrolase-like protein with peptidoglycan-binding domain
MIRPITRIALNERSEAVANLHAAMQALGFAVAAGERDEQRAGEDTVRAVRLFQRQMNIEPAEGLLVDDFTAASVNFILSTRGQLDEPTRRSYSVAGVVTTAAGQPARGLLVTAFDQDMRRRQTLGAGRTDANGRYAVSYEPRQFREATIGGADLVVEVTDAAGAVLFTSGVRFNSADQTTIDVDLPASTVSEFDAMTAVLDVLIEGQGVTLATLEEDGKTDDVTFAAGETGFAYDGLMDFAIAQRLGAQGKLPPAFWHGVLRTGAIAETVSASAQPPGLEALARDVLGKVASTPAAAISAGLVRAAKANIIVASTQQITAWVRAYGDLQTTGTDPASSPAGQLGSVIGLSGDAQTAFAAAFVAGGARSDILARLAGNASVTAAQLADIETTLLVNDLVIGDVGLVKAVKDKVPDLASAPKLAKLTADDWAATIKQAAVTPPAYVAGDTDAVKQANYAGLIAKRLSVTYPTAAFGGRLAAAAKPAIGQAATIAAFIDAHPDFELATTSVDGYLKTKASADFANQAASGEFVQQLKAAQRVFKLAPDFDAVNTLLGDNLHSASQIYRLGKTQFINLYQTKSGFSGTTANVVFQKAANTYAAVATVLGDLRSTLQANQIQGLANPAPALNDLPDWSDLFGPGDFCECEDCRSIFSPAAYLADLLKWLEARKLDGTTTSAKDILFGRRPDLGYIELSCDNSTVELPYIDLACEIMEDLVAPWILFNLPAATVIAAGPVSAALQQAFATAAPIDPAQGPVTLSPAAVVYGPDHYGAWIVRDGDTTYRAASGPGGFAVSILRQTHGPSEDLMAYPEYVNQAAYATLGAADYPMALPFDLYAESVRAYLGLANLTRAQVMDAFRGKTAANPSDLDIACEYISVSAAEQALIFNADASHQYIYWGQPDNATAVAQLSQVDVFLQATGLDFNGMQTLLSLKFVNPDGAIVVQNLDGSCDTDMKRLQVLDANALDRIHRFLRLWRKLGWQMWEVDLTIGNAGLGAGTLDDAFALTLKPFLELKARLGTLSIEQLCSFFDNLNTTGKFTAAYQKPTPSLYEQLFLNTRTSGPIDPDFAIATVSGATTKVIDDHQPRILAADKIKATDLVILRALIKPAAQGSTPYIDSALSLGNLSFLYRHAMLSRALGVSVPDWQTLLLLLQLNPFTDPDTALEFTRTFDRIKKSGFTVDQLDYLLTDDLTAKAAAPAKTITTTLGALKAALQSIAATYDPSQVPTDLSALGDAIGAQLQVLGWDAGSAADAVAVLNGTLQLSSVGPATPLINFPASAPATFDPTTSKIYFTGVMTDAQQTALLTTATPAAVLADPNYVAAINELHDLPRLLVKLYDPAFSTSLASLPAAVQFTTLDKGLAARVAYDQDQETLSFFGVMTRAEQALLVALSPDATYGAAIQALYQAPRAGGFPADQLWMGPTELVDNMQVADTRLVTYLARKLSTDQVVQQIASAFGLTQATASSLLADYPLFGGGPPRTLMLELLDPSFVASGAGVTLTTFPNLFQDYYWLHRVALVLSTVAAVDSDFVWMVDNPAAKGVLDFSALPLTAVNTTTSSPGQLFALLGLAEFMSFHHAWSDGKTSLLDVVDRLIGDATYTSALFGVDLEALAGWQASDGQALADSLDLTYPAAYCASDGWRRLNRCFTIIQQVTGNGPGLLALAPSVMGETQDESLRGMLRAQYSEQDWLTNNQNVQNGLRERKRDSLIAYLMAKGAPANAPNTPWTDPNDMFDCYLIDVQMCSCMPTTRVVQAYAAVQLFVQRCLMGLEPDARANVEADDGWAQWEWMKFYRLWEANRQVFAYPENYVEPELRKANSDLFQDLETTLLQNGVTNDNAESAFLAYLEGLDDIAQLEIAGTFYQEDIQTLHVFGRSAGGDPRLYYYRQFISGRRWTAWSKVDLDIKGDYLTPFVFDERLYVVWLEFQQGQGSTQTAAIPSPSQSSVSIQGDGGAQKTMSVYLAISELRNGKWTTKRLADSPFETDPFSGEYDETQFLIAPLDLTWLPGVLFPNGAPKGPVPAQYQWLVESEFLILVRNQDPNHPFTQLFQMAGCRGYPEDFQGDLWVVPLITTFQNSTLDDDRDVANAWAADLTPNAGTLLPAVEILGNLPSLFEVSYPHYLSMFDRMLFLFGVLLGFAQQQAVLARDGAAGIQALLGTFYDWFYADSRRTFHVRPELYLRRQKLALFYEDIAPIFLELTTLIAPGQWAAFSELLLRSLRDDLAYQLRFATFYHPLTCTFISALYSGGVDALMARETQFADGGLDFLNAYAPTAIVDIEYPDETAVFDDPTERYAHAYASYNWELFYFAPVMVAEQLSQNQQFQDAMSWYHYVFDPTGGHDRDPISGMLATAPQKYWITKPFYLRQSADYLQQRIENLMTLLADDPSNPTPPALLIQLQNEVQDWRNDPFDPHLIAQYRTVAYQKFVVMKYLDNLIAWGDQQFTMDTMESVNIATQLYVLAAHILGKEPEIVPPAAKPVPETFNELDDSLDAFSNAIIQFENLIPPMPGQGGGTLPAAGIPAMLYFCIPQNDQLLQYWDTVADRLYKIRHCLNIDGVFSPPVLFPPPINPMDLVRATALGGDLSSALADLAAPLPYYRFSTMLQMANAVAADVKTLGAALLTALEKKDAEGLALLRQGQEIALLQAVRGVKQQQIDDASIALAALQKNQELVTQRYTYYSSREFMNPGETAAASLNAASLAIDAAIAAGYILSGGLMLLPDFMIGAAGFGGSPTVNATMGGQTIGNSAEEAVKTISSIAAALDKAASVASVVAGYQRRMDDWQFQAQSASKELEQIAQQIQGAQKKIDIATTELANQELQIANAQAVNTFMQSKYTNEDLYQWQVGQISQTYFASYNLACSIARNAEQCFRYELGVENSSYIQPGYWNSLRSGLEAGESLQLDLRRMESDYHSQNRREFECVKHVSLAQINPQALTDLKGGGVGQFSLPEELFDLDFPGHYFRRIKSVSLSIPCVAGPYTTVNATLRLLSNMVRINTSGATYEHANDGGVFTDDDRFRQSNVRVTAIATSSGQNDSGMFELNFRDERYLPFEGAGAISTWQIEMMDDPELRQFSYATISDVIIHLRYTAREDAGPFRTGAKNHLHDVISGAEPQLPQWRLFDLMREFPTEWYAMLNPPGGGAQALQLPITRQQFPFLAQDKVVNLQSAVLVVRNQKKLSVVIDPPFASTDPAQSGAPIIVDVPPTGTVYAQGSVGAGQPVALDETTPWSLRFLATGTLAATDIAECYLAVGYTLE